eukprot:6188760-Pleurochrysis_carterae.AAC.2
MPPLPCSASALDGPYDALRSGAQVAHILFPAATRPSSALLCAAHSSDWPVPAAGTTDLHRPHHRILGPGERRGLARPLRVRWGTLYL